MANNECSNFINVALIDYVKRIKSRKYSYGFLYNQNYWLKHYQ